MVLWATLQAHLTVLIWEEYLVPRVSVKDQGLARPRVGPAWDFALCCVWTFGRLVGFARDIGPSRQPALLTGGVTSEEVHGIFASRFSLSIPLGTCSVAPHLSESHLRARTEEDAAGPRWWGTVEGAPRSVLVVQLNSLLTQLL